MKLADFAGKDLILYFLSEGRHTGLHQGGLRLPRLLEGDPEARRGRGGRLARLGRVSTRSSVAKYKLPFPLLSDPDKKVMTAYGAFGEKMMYGKKVTGVIRSTVWIGPDGKVKKHWAACRRRKRTPRRCSKH